MSDKKQQFDSYVKYTNLAIQMVLIIGIGVWGGIQLDKLLNSNPLMTILLSIIGVVIAIFIVIKTLLNTK